MFGEEVNGNAHVVFGVLKDGQKRSLPNSLQRVPVSIPLVYYPSPFNTIIDLYHNSGLSYCTAILFVDCNVHPLITFQIDAGKGVVTLKREHITNTFPNIDELEKAYIFVAATVLTEDGKKTG